MHFGKKPAAVIPPQLVPEMEWPDLSLRQQSFWVQVTEWDYKVFPSMGSDCWGTWLFQFEGRTKIGFLKGLHVVGEIIVHEPDEDLGRLSDYWTNVPKDLNGVGFLMHDKENALHKASFGLELYCKAEALDWVYRAFSCSFVAQSSGLGIAVSIAYPDPVAPHFWKMEWREKKWQVTSWGLFAGVHVPSNRSK